MTQVYDLSDPTHPVKIGISAFPVRNRVSTGAVRPSCTGRSRPARRQPHLFRVWHQQGRLPADRRSRQADERTEGAEPDNLRLPEISRLAMSAFNGAHTVFPMKAMPIAEFAHDKDGKARDIVMIVDEAILNECNEPRQMVWFADVTVETAR